MDSFQTFLDIFKRAKEENDSTGLTEILTTSRTYFQNVSKDESELMLSKLFDKDTGLLLFLKNELNRANTKKHLDKAMKEAFSLLEFIIDQFSDIFVPYLIETKNICQKTLIIQCSALIRKAACSTFKKLIEEFHEYEFELGETVEQFTSSFPLLDIKERSLIFSVLGTIIKCNPELLETEEHSQKIFQHLRNDFRKQFNPETIARSIDTFQIYLEVLCNTLISLPNEMIIKYSEEIYNWVKELSKPEKYSFKKVTLRAAIDLLATHIHHFREFVYHDYKYWNQLLLKVAEDKNVQCSRCAQSGLRRYYRKMGHMLNYKTSDDDKAVFMYFISFFEERLKNDQHVNSNILRFIVYGFSQMAASCKKYRGNEAVKDMFSLIAHYALTLCPRDNLEQIQLESISTYQEALAEIILHIDDLSYDQINVITKLSILLVKSYPDIPLLLQNLAILSLNNTIISIGTVSKSILDEYLYHLIHDGVVWTCSHTLLVDAELQRGIDDLKESPVSYKNYLHLWLELLKPNRYKNHRNLVQQVADSMINVGIVLISKLNLNTKTKEDTIFSDAAFSQVAENNADFRMFVNIVDLYIDIINDIEPCLLTNTLQKFLLKIIIMSYKHPLISGFYKLVRVLFNHVCVFSKDDIEAEVLELLYKYLMNVLHLISTFSNELLTTCLNLILNTPILFVKLILNNTIPAFKIACTIGLSDLELACTTLSALELWTNRLDNKDTHEFLLEVVPYLEPYLQSGESSTEMLQDIIKTERKVIKRIILRDDENTLERFQMRVLLFIASLDTDIILNFIYKRSMNVGATWDKKDLLKYSLTFSDTQVDICFDKILPRLMLLAQNSGDRRIKISACEVLHSIISFILGKTTQHLTTNADKFVSIYVTLYPALLNLGCDFDETARNIFQPLILQLTHWLSSKFMLKSPATIYFLDSLFNGLSNESNSSLREFSGICLAEFSKWSMRQSDDDRTLLNIDEVMYKIKNFALHPSMFKRIAAATAFNHLYTILREDEEIVSKYWLEILYYFVKSLDGCNDISIITALDHVERVLIAKRDLLNDKYKHRKKPHEFEDATLTDAVNWLFTQCGCLDQSCRAKCMELVTKFSIYVSDCDSTKTMINNYIDTHEIEAFNLIILQDLKPKIETLSSSNIMPLLRSLDCYIWLMRNNLLDVEYLLGNSNSKREVIFNCAKNFIYLMNKIKIEEKEINLIMISEEFDNLQTLQCKTVTTTFDFLQILLSLDENLIPDFFFNKDCYKLIAKCIMCPYVVGFNVKNFEIIEALPVVMGNLLQSITRKTDNSLWHLIKCELSIYAEKHLKHFLDLETIISGLNGIALKQYVRGLIFLERHNLLGQLHNVTEYVQQPEDRIEQIFKILVKEQMRKLVCINIRASVKDYLQILMEFLFVHYKPSMIKTIIKLIENDTEVLQDSKNIAYGIYFLQMFKNEIFRYMLIDPEQTVQLLNEQLQGNPSLFLTILEQLLLFVRQHKKELRDSTQTLVNSVIKKFTLFENVVNNFEDRKQKLINIFGIAVHLMLKPIEVLSLNKDFYLWILNQLMESSNIDYKIQILQNFLVCLTDMTSTAKPELLVILRNLKSYRTDVSPSDFDQRNVKATKVINYFQTLLTLLPVTESVIVYETIILFAAGIAEYLCNEKTNEYLEKYFNLITTEYVMQSIESAYKLFLKNSPTNERFDILHKFLLPSFQFCKTPETREFFERNIKEIHTIICQSFIGNSSDIKQLVVSKIGCYNLITIMFAKINIGDIDSTESLITRNAIDSVTTGKELIQSLYSNVLNIRTLKTPDPEHKEIIRLLHCSAYNCCISMVCSLKKDENSYLSIFAENRKKGQLIWENIVDWKQYKFKQMVNERPKNIKKLINIRKNTNDRKTSSQYSSFNNNDFSTCTLNEDINAYDFNETTLRNVSNTEEESMSLTFESDELNNHECMASICGVFNHIASEKISVPSTDEADVTMPKWLKAFLNSVVSAECNNVRLFMLKIVFNMQDVFKPYVKFFMEPIMYTVYIYLKQNGLNYIILDIVEMLLSWQFICLRDKIEYQFKAHNGKLIVQQFWEIIIDKVVIKRTTEVSKSVYKYNMNLIKRILQAWSDYLKVPEKLENKMKVAPESTVNLILICLDSKLKKDIIQRNDIIEFLENTLKQWQTDEEKILQTCECFGLILEFVEDNDELRERIIGNIRRILREIKTKFESRQIKCILALCKNYQKAAKIYFEIAFSNIFKVDALSRSNCLEIFLHCIPSLSINEMLNELDYMKFADILKNKVLLCEEVALKIIDSLAPILPPSNILTFANLVPPYTKNELSKYRELAYSIFKRIYIKYVTDTSNDDDIKKLMLLSTEVLLNGVLDPSETLQNKILDFWTQDAQLTNTCKERLLEILSKCTPAVSNNFLPFILLMILDLPKKSSNYNEKLFEPLHNCSYRDYKIALSWRTKNLGSKAPLFAASLTSQMNQTFTQISSAFTYDPNTQLQLQATQDLEFEPTYIDGESVQPPEYDGVFKIPALLQPSSNKTSPRFIANSHEVSATAREKEIQKNIHRHRMIKEEKTRQRNSVKLYRKYRIGDFPDIEISHASLIEPLQQLAMKDLLICKDLIVSIVCSLLKESKHNDFMEQTANSLKGIIENEQASSTTRAILEILLETRIVNCSPEVIAKASRSNCLNFLGSLVLEEYLIYGTDVSGPSTKRPRTEGINDSSSEWLQLTNLYQSMNNVDVVLSIFQNHITHEDIRTASFAQISNNWLKAKVAYEKAYEVESELIKEHCLQGLFECLSNLCTWDEIDKHIKNRLNKNINNIWNDPWKDWMFPWLFEVFAHKLVSGSYSNEFKNDIEAVETWLEDEIKVKHIKRCFGEELSMFFLWNKQLEVSNDFLLNTLDEMKEEWIELHPLSTQLRIRKLQKLRIINDVNRYIKLMKTRDNASDMEISLKIWNSSVPSPQDALLPWDKLMSYRTSFINSVLDDKLKELEQNSTQSTCDEEENEISQKLQTVTFNMRLKMVEASLNQKHKYIAKKYLKEIEQNKLRNEDSLQLLLSGAKLKYLMGELETSVEKKLSNYTSSWKHCHNLLQKDNLSSVVNVDVRKQISNIASKLVKLSEEDETFSTLLTTNAIVLKDIKVENSDLAAIKDSLESYSFNNLATCCSIKVSSKNESYYVFAKYCYEKLSRGSKDIQLIREFVRCTLKAMIHGSCEAAHYFPCLLKPEYFEDQETKDIFTKHTEHVQTWLFLSWQAQLFSHLGTSISPLIIPILKRIAETYPDAIIYTFHLTMETNPVLLNDARTYEIRQILYNRSWIERFLAAMQYVVQPELYLIHYLGELIKNLPLGTSTAIDIFMNKVYPNLRANRDSIKPGSIFNEIAKYKNQIKGLERKKPEEIKRQIAQMVEQIKESLNRRRNKYKLIDYSPWLYNFSEKNIEIPGQYTGNSRPIPQNHVKIMKIEPSVKVMQSLRKPIRITMLGNDGKEYYFLVKFGEDLRQDQRLQQLLSTMNKILHVDPACRQRQLSIDTYQVIPLSRTVGLIQWVNNTRTLNESINFTLSSQETSRYNSILKEYIEWIRSATNSGRQHEWYKEAVMKYNAVKVTTKMNELIGKTEWDSLRRTFSALCPTVESFVTMRQNFITSYATMCIAHWALGIGDRHLENTLINVDSGRCLGIDFGLAFDAGVDQRIPELMPFRLTPQILGLLKPFSEKDLLGAIMIHTLRAIRNEQGPILSCMDVFVHEPLNWTEHINKTLRENEEDVADVKWVPMKKIEAVIKKLNGIKPSLITLDQLKEQHNDACIHRYRAIVTGDDDIKRTRAKMKDNFLTPEEQVECLLDQATDLNILGRTSAGWRPWL
ncbi:DNA-dependent protein kinase catalytic subunit-like [Osmia bicornis bicornis]|uniref:DNA-dependent protein kinase catalytic subunit-like n=1 Tax=Osmia bicornis bicornis TaxID=1437191 RepID=UPI001EAF8989|nr:DNA-dependent protein kinase catalytic subunit-like [Osmia bicornis bicornis]XP_029034557.2 DNA-dependent protein kinase catalytic subunit-like [Osmia bicornis bicornis]XP_029034558.2 DNA-dependent protein kinase catalytic subunit-like [Osmia bicornis bicornis]XP_046141239.1 DNA-dependent protein kinase catalytic subunit-like [Osmia bicornis bicornis]